MALTATYFDLWTGVDNQAGTTFNIAWKDFNPTEPTSFFQSKAYRITSSAPTNLSNYRYWHEIVVAVAERTNNTGSSITAELKIAFVFPWWNNRIYSFGTQTLSASWWRYTWYAYAWIDYDEFTTNWTATIWMLANSSVLSAKNITYSNYDTVRNTERTSWYMWVEWDNIHYIDGAKWDTWYEHMIDNDGSSSYIWADKAWAIRLDDWWTNRKIHYIDSSGYLRKTYEANNRYWWASYVWTSKKWYIRVSDWDTADWYGYLCFVWNNWYRYRIMNWPV